MYISVPWMASSSNCKSRKRLKLSLEVKLFSYVPGAERSWSKILSSDCSGIIELDHSENVCNNWWKFEKLRCCYGKICFTNLLCFVWVKPLVCVWSWCPWEVMGILVLRVGNTEIKTEEAKYFWNFFCSLTSISSDFKKFRMLFQFLISHNNSDIPELKTLSLNTAKDMMQILVVVL